MTNWRLKEVLMVLTMILTSTLCLPGTANAQCNIGVDLSNSSGPIEGFVGADGQTWKSPANCTSGQVRVETWIEGVVLNQNKCYGSFYVGGACVENSYNDADSWATENNACGWWTGRSNHWLVDDQWYAVELGRSRSVGYDCGPTPQEICLASGGTWQNGDCVPPNSPILVNVRTQRYALTSPAEGVRFDINGDGTLEQVAWTQAGDTDVAFLARDVDGDGKITSGKELFGSFTVPGVYDGFQALAVLAGDPRTPNVEDGMPLFDQLLLWTDLNHNGQSEASELQPAREVLARIGTGRVRHNRRDGHGNLFFWRGWVHLRTAPGKNPTTTPGEDRARTRTIYDVIFQTLK